MNPYLILLALFLYWIYPYWPPPKVTPPTKIKRHGLRTYPDVSLVLPLIPFSILSYTATSTFLLV